VRHDSPVRSYLADCTRLRRCEKNEIRYVVCGLEKPVAHVGDWLQLHGMISRGCLGEDLMAGAREFETVPALVFVVVVQEVIRGVRVNDILINLIADFRRHMEQWRGLLIAAYAVTFVSLHSQIEMTCLKYMTKLVGSGVRYGGPFVSGPPLRRSMLAWLSNALARRLLIRGRQNSQWRAMSS
jgi:hypothetical protein